MVNRGKIYSMKNNLILLLLFFSCVGFSQTNSVVGKWKVVSIDNGEIYYNVKTDSISVSQDLQDVYGNDESIKMLKDMMKKGYSFFEFDTKGVFIMGTQFGTIESKYTNDVQRSIIMIEGKNSFNENVIDEMPYKFNDGQLHLSLTFAEPPALLVLEKLK